MGKKSSPAPPDYTQQRGEFAQSEYQKRLGEASTYNSAIETYNSRLTKDKGTLDTLGGQVRSLSIVDDEKFDGLANSIRSLQTGLTGAAPSLATPNFASTVSSPYGAVDVGVPTLNQINTNLSSGFSSQAAELLGSLDSLRQQRKAEEKRIDDYASQFRQAAGGIGSTITGLDIRNQAGIDAARQSIDALRSGYGGFTSAILGEYNPLGSSYADQQFTSLGNQLAGVQGRRQAGLDAVKSYETGLTTTYDTLASQFAGLGIRDLDQLKAIQGQIDAAQLGATRYSAPVEFDLSQEIAPYSDLEARVANMAAKREAEDSRIKSAYADANTSALGILGQVGASDIYNGTNLNSLALAIQQMRDQIGGFSSELDTNFNPYLSRLSEAEGQLQSLRDQRTNALSGFGSRMTALDAEGDARNAYDLAGHQDTLSRLNGVGTEMAGFSGTDVRGFSNQLSGLRDELNSRINNVYSTRNTIEQEARDFLTNAEGSSFYTTGDIDTMQEQFKALQSRSSQWGAAQTADEFASITGLFGDQRTRLATETKAAEDRALKEREATLAALQNPYSMFASMSDMSPDDYLAFLSSWNQRNPSRQNAPTSFAQQLGMIYA